LEHELSLYQTSLVGTYQTIPMGVLGHAETSGRDLGRRVPASPPHNGDIFESKTRDAENYPLPLVGFLQLHDLLWGVIAVAGLLADPDSAPAAKLKRQTRKQKTLH